MEEGNMDRMPRDLLSIKMIMFEAEDILRVSWLYIEVIKTMLLKMELEQGLLME